MCTTESVRKFASPRVAPREGSCQEVHFRGAHLRRISARARGSLLLIFRLRRKTRTDREGSRS